MARAAAAIRALGIDGDPYYHPGLSGTTPIPTLRLGTDPSVAENLKLEIQRRVGPTVDRVTPDLFDDAAMAVADRVGTRRRSCGTPNRRAPCRMLGRPPGS